MAAFFSARSTCALSWLAAFGAAGCDQPFRQASVHAPIRAGRRRKACPPDARANAPVTPVQRFEPIPPARAGISVFTRLCRPVLLSRQPAPAVSDRALD